MSAQVIEWQILAKDPAAAAAFYGSVFEWQVDSDNSLGYRRIAAGSPDGIGGGIWPAPPDGHNFVQLFIGVDDVPRYVARAEAIGARPLIPPQKLPDGDELAIMLDPFGMPFGIMKKAVRALLLILLLFAPRTAWAQVKLTQAPDQVAVEIDGKPFTVFHLGGADLKRPYLHPLRSATGTIVNRSFPAGQVPGETTDHPHHAGLFYGHGDVNGFNYWAVQNVARPQPPDSANFGRIVLQKIAAVKSGQESGSLDVVLTWLKPDGAPLMTETRRTTFYAHPELRIIDFDFDFAAIDTVVFRDTKEGTFAMRMATALDEPPLKPKPGGPARTGKLTNAQGGVGETNVWGKRSEWVDYSGQIDGEKVGVVMMDHPGNPRHPTYWHSRGYGLHSINPFGVSDFLNDKTQNGSLTIAPGQRVRFRYRVVIHPGLTPARLAELYKKFVSMASI